MRNHGEVLGVAFDHRLASLDCNNSRHCRLPR
jgi:hypothetical protein